MTLPVSKQPIVDRRVRRARLLGAEDARRAQLGESIWRASTSASSSS
jgi:hypothetical protein